MVSKINSIGIYGIDGFLAEIEADVSKGMPSFDIVGLPDSAVKESKERVLAAIKNCGYKLTLGRIVVNLAPADVKKEGSVFDLPVFLAILRSQGIIKCSFKDSIFAGELSLSGELRGISGILPIVITAKKLGFKRVFVPLCNATEAAVVPDIEVYGAETAVQVVEHLCGISALSKAVFSPKANETAEEFPLDFADVCGQEMAKRAIEVACAGGHNILLL